MSTPPTYAKALVCVLFMSLCALAVADPPPPNVPVDFSAYGSVVVNYLGQDVAMNGSLYWDFTNRNSLLQEGVSDPVSWFLQKCLIPGTTAQYSNDTEGQYCTVNCLNGSKCENNIMVPSPSPAVVSARETIMKAAKMIFGAFGTSVTPTRPDLKHCGCDAFNPLQYLDHLHYNGTCTVGGKSGTLWSNSSSVYGFGEVKVEGCLTQSGNYSVPLQLKGVAQVAGVTIGSIAVDVASFDPQPPASDVFDLPSMCSCQPPLAPTLINLQDSLVAH